MTSYASIHKANEQFLLAVIGFLVLAFVAAMILMFVHPSVALGVFAVGLIVALVSGVIEALFKRSERAAVRTSIRAQQCPLCGGPVRDEAGAWSCPECDRAFLASGLEEA